MESQRHNSYGVRRIQSYTPGLSLAVLATLALSLSQPIADQMPVGTPAPAAGSAVVDFSELARAAAGSSQAGVLPVNPRRTEVPWPGLGPAEPVGPEGGTGFAKSLGSPAPTLTFQGLMDQGVGAYPPDTDGAVGLNEVMEGINFTYRVQAKTNGAIISTVPMGTFWAGLGGSGFFDPKTLYDPINNRWIVVVLSDAKSTNSSIEVGVSQTGDPTSLYN